MDNVRPNFLIVGAAKAGTTSIYHYLSEHPDIFFPRIKEPCFFTSEKPASEWARTWEDYLDLFKGGAGYKWRGEASTPYLYYHEEVIPQILDRLGRCKIIIVLRNPVQRAWSMYTFNRTGLREPLSFEDALAAEEMRIRNKWQAAFHYQRLGFTANAVKSYKKAFGDQASIFFYDDLRADANAFMKQVYDFMEVSPLTMKRTGIHNASGIPKNARLHALLYNRAVWKEPIKKLLPEKFRQNLKEKILSFNLERQDMPTEAKSRLVALYRDDIAELETVTGRDLSHWKKG